MSISTAVDVSAVARVVGIKTAFKDLRGDTVLFLPQRIALVGQGASSVTYSTDKTRYTRASEVGAAYGYGSPVHLAAMEFLPVNGSGIGTIPLTVYPLEDGDSAVAATGTITPSGTATEQTAHRVVINNIKSTEFVISVDDTLTEIGPKISAAINANVNMPVIATESSGIVTITSKWKGESANAIYMELTGDEDPVGASIAFTQVSGGLVNPDVTVATDQIGNVWETLVLNCLNIDDEVALDAYQSFGEGRWGALVRKPLTVWTGVTETTVSAATAISSTRTDDRVNGQLVAPGSNDLPFVVAAAQLTLIAVLANNNPPHDYGAQEATTLTAGPDGDQWLYSERDEAVKAGSSTIEVVDDVVQISDVVTFYAPTGETPPPYRFLVDIVKVSTILFNLDYIFTADEWNGAPLIPDDQPTINRTAKRPRMAVAEVVALAESLALNAIISNADFTKDNTEAGINDQNPKRLDLSTVMKVSGNTNIISVDFNFGFYFGTTSQV